MGVTSDVKAHKAMVFSTGGFQSGALKYAEVYGIATIAFVDGNFTYNTRSRFPMVRPTHPDLPRFSGLFLTCDDATIHCTLVADDKTAVLSSWLQSQ